MTENKTKSIYEKLQNARNDFVEHGVGKGGKNKFSNYDYFNLNDILPVANPILNNNRLTPVFNLYEDEAELVIYDFDSDKTITFRTDNADAVVLNKSGLPSMLEIQTLGSKHTYLKRYLYMNALEIAETDSIEEKTGNPDYTPNVPKKRQAEPKNKPKPLLEKATQEQIEVSKEILTPEMLVNMLAKYEVSDIKDMEKETLHKILIIRQNQLKKEKEEKKEDKPYTKYDKEGNEIKETASKTFRLDDVI